jgi:hypothetical protein
LFSIGGFSRLLFLSRQVSSVDPVKRPLPFNEAGSLTGKMAELHVTHMVPRNVGVRLQAKVFPTTAGK